MRVFQRRLSFASDIRLGLVASVLLVLSAPARAYEKDALNIGVQSEVEGAAAKPDHPSAPGTDKPVVTYFLAAPHEVWSKWQLLKPVDPKFVAQEVRKVLQPKGYRPALKGEKPDVVIMVLYGRGWVHNPYPVPLTAPPGAFTSARDWNVRDVIKMQNSEAFVTSSSILNDKQVRDDQEKLFIIVASWVWDPPALLKHKGKQLWYTIDVHR